MLMFRNPISNLKYFTNWGVYYTLFNTIFSLIISFQALKLKKDDTAREIEKSEDKTSPFKAWKCHIIFLEISMIINIIITLFFFVVLYNPTFCKLLDEYEDFGNLTCISNVTSHCVPLICTIIEICINVTPLYFYRHLPFLIAISFLYLVVNFTVTKVSGKPVYSIMSFNSIFSWSLPVIILIFGISLFACCSYINQLKLKLIGYKDLKDDDQTQDQTVELAIQSKDEHQVDPNTNFITDSNNASPKIKTEKV